MESSVLKIQSYYRMVLKRRIYKLEILNKQKERKRMLNEIEEQTKRVNLNYNVDRRKLLIETKSIIKKNYPGIRLHDEKIYGKKPYETIVIKSYSDEIGRSCPLSLRRHSKNSIYFTVSVRTQEIYLKCFKCDGYQIIDHTTSKLNEIKGLITISDKSSNNSKSNTSKVVPKLSLDIVKFEHIPIHVDKEEVFDFYNINEFAITPAKLTKKSPVFSSWTDTVYDPLVTINMEKNNVAIVCGKNSNLFVVDVDIKDNGLKYFQNLCQINKYNYITSTTCVLTPSGGLHMYYKYDDKISSNTVRFKDDEGNKIGIDIRTQGGCVISPPSKYDDKQYRFLSLLCPQTCPEFLLSLISS